MTRDLVTRAEAAQIGAEILGVTLATAKNHMTRDTYPHPVLGQDRKTLWSTAAVTTYFIAKHEERERAAQLRAKRQAEQERRAIERSMPKPPRLIEKLIAGADFDELIAKQRSGFRGVVIVGELA